MAEYMEKATLYKDISELEELARNRVLDTPTNSPVYVRYVAQLNERTMLKHKIFDFPAADVAPVVHGRWILEVHKDRANYRWNVIAECSECCDERKEIWSGFFPNVPDYLARDVSLINAKEVELSNYCPNCGAKMDKE